MEKKKLISEGKLDKYGRVNDNTPNSWKNSFVDLSAVGTKDDPSTSSLVAFPHTKLITTIPTAPVASTQSTEDQEEGTSSTKKVFFFLKKRKKKKDFNNYYRFYYNIEEN